MDIQIQNHKLNEIAVDCGLHIAEHNPEVTAKEVSFYAEEIVRECISVVLEHSSVPKVDLASKLYEHFQISR